MKYLLFAYLILINIIGLFLYGLDKAKSKSKSNRIPERTLLWVARIGGEGGCWIGMMFFRHKTKHIRFKIVVPLWTIIWVVGVAILIRIC